MISGLVPFAEIIESVKDETGIENMRPFYDKIRRLIFRAEREIGYGGTVVLRKKIYKNPRDYNGKYFPYPIDFIELEGVGQDCLPMNPYSYTKTSDGIRFREVQTKDVVLLYWGLYCDDEGNPVSTRNHEEAVIAFIVWKFYSPKVFLGIGNMNAKKDYQNTFEDALREARGDDAFPTLEEWNEIGLLSYADRRGLIMQPTASYNYCATEEEECDNVTLVEKVYFWQLDNISQTLADIIPLFANTTYLFSKDSLDYEVFEQGKIVSYTNVAKIAFAIHETTDLNFVINDSLGNDITDEFDTYYADAIKAMIFVSKNHYVHSSIYFNFKKL